MTYKEFKSNLDDNSESLEKLKEVSNQMLWYLRTLEKPTDRPEGRNTHSIQKSLRWYMKKTSILIDEVFIDKVNYEQFYKLKLKNKFSIYLKLLTWILILSALIIILK